MLKIKNYRKNTWKYGVLPMSEYIKEEYIEDGYYAIHVSIPDRNDIYNPFSLGRQKELSSDLYEYIEKKSELTPRELPLKIILDGSFSDAEKDEIRNVLKEHYNAEIYKIMGERRSNLKKIILLAVFGILLLSACVVLHVAADQPVFSEILGVISSFSLWEATDFALLERPELNSGFVRLHQLEEMEVAFMD